ncbi:unnamed protein product [Brachionus calyciflorus]|uniref:Uncharacterized protein n=1 Tax=Brachionus calyciflorus TaxID=104777 RepID=A0A813M0U0_9BILA|nr:unnamed protein product [Brachionus calyciflorus]
MVVKLDFNECLKDSPNFRKNLSLAETDLENYENIYKKIHENSLAFYNDGIKYLDSYRRMIDFIQSLGSLLSEKEEGFTKRKIENFCSLLKDSRQCEENFLNESFKSVSEKINKFVENDLKQLKEQRKQFERISLELDNAYNKNSEALKNKPQICEEMEKNLCGIKKTYGHNGLEYICQINRFYLVRSHSILNMIQLYSQSLKSFYQYGNVLVHEHDTELAEISTNLSLMNENEQKCMEKMEHQHDILRSNDYNSSCELSSGSSTSSTSSIGNQSQNLFLTGYLYKRSHHNTFKKWNRRWFTLINSKLFYQKKSDYNTGINEMESDLRVCKVREINDGERRFTFEIVSPKCRHILQADSQKECNLWVKTIDKAINNAINNLLSNSPLLCGNNDFQMEENFDAQNDFLESLDIFNSLNDSNNGGISTNSNLNGSSSKAIKDLEKSSSSISLRKKNELTENKNFVLTTVKGNQLCCDCGAPNPSWISINIGAILCIECSGKHRGLGVHISKVRSLNLDELGSETLCLLMNLGNDLVNSIYEKMFTREVEMNDNLKIQRATPKCDNSIRESWIKAKYASKIFVKPFRKLVIKISKSVNEEKNYTISIVDSTENIENDTDSNVSYINVQTKNELLHLACSYGDIPLMSYAIALDADRNSIIDRANLYSNENSQTNFQINETLNGYSPLIKAVHSGSIPAVELLILNGAKLNLCDFNGQTALHHATILNNLKLVCLLLKRGADPLSLDKNNVDPIMIATDNCQPNIVTILRVAKMNNDLKEQDLTYSGDPMFDEILKDLLTINMNNIQSKTKNSDDTHTTDYNSDTSRSSDQTTFTLQ